MNSLYMRNFVCVCTLLLPVIAFAQIPVRKYKTAIIDASMENTLNLQMRYNSSKDLQTYAVQMPVKIKRVLKLQLIKE